LGDKSKKRWKIATRVIGNHEPTVGFVGWVVCGWGVGFGLGISKRQKRKRHG